MRRASLLRLVGRAYRFVNRPYYLYQPGRLARRLTGSPDRGGEPHLERTAWGSQLYCFDDPLGSALHRTGVYELAVGEALVRLAESGETALDAGANVGLFSSLLAGAVGSSGRVISFEPHPEIHSLLERNVELWRSEGVDNVVPRRAAVSSTSGLGALHVGSEFEANRGTASLQPIEGEALRAPLEVATVRLDEEIEGGVGVLKLDVEGNEHEALSGATRLLTERAIRDIVFESHREPPTPVTELLAGYGYAIFGLREGLSGPLLRAPGTNAWRANWDPPTLIATADPDRALARFKRRGWMTLRRRR
jgi:FkbM family methyltransferase